MSASGPRVIFHHQFKKTRAPQKRPTFGRKPEFSITQILSWADAFHRRTGQWPNQYSGRITESPDDTWNAVNSAMREGLRGLEKGSSIAKLLAKERGVRNIQDLPRLTIPQILTWADEHHSRTGKWPIVKSGPIREAPGETWSRVHIALFHGVRGFRGGTTLLQVLVKHRRIRNRGDLPPLQVQQILAWADEHHRRTEKWPVVKSGPILDAPGEIWINVDQALRKGLRGYPGGSSLAQLLAEHRRIRNVGALTSLSPELILGWADAHHRRTGQWPTLKSGSISEAPGETWQGVYHALWKGYRGFPGGSSLARLLLEHRGVRNRASPPRLSPKQILMWADAHHRSTGQWPNYDSGPIAGIPGETWLAVDSALFRGGRGLSSSITLWRFLKQHGRV